MQKPEVKEVEKSNTAPEWVDEAHTRFAWGKVRPWQEADCFSEAAASGNYD